MFSSRLIAALALLATVAALPATDKDRTVPVPITSINDDEVPSTTYKEEIESPWFTFPIFANLFAPIWNLFPSFADIGPQIISDDDKFQVIMNVKNYKKDDLSVKVKEDFLFIRGSRETKHDDHDFFTSQFFHSYTLPANASAADVTAQLTSDGKLVVTAPISKGPVNNTEDREVSIIETGKPFAKEDDKEKPIDSNESPVSESVEDDRKEPTTPSTKVDITEKDNDIPHGSN